MTDPSSRLRFDGQLTRSPGLLVGVDRFDKVADTLLGTDDPEDHARPVGLVVGASTTRVPARNLETPLGERRRR